MEQQFNQIRRPKMCLKKKIMKSTGLHSKHSVVKNNCLIQKVHQKFVIKRQKNKSVLSLVDKNKETHEFTSETHENSASQKINEECKGGILLSVEERIGWKVSRVKNFWKGASLLIPNVFRLTCLLEDNLDQALEYQDLSKKEVLAQNGGAKGRIESTEESKSENKFEKKRNQKRKRVHK